MSQQNFYLAIQDFHKARRRADLQHILARLTGKSDRLLSYEDVRTKLRAIESARQQLKAIPIDAIVGTVGRYADFTRRFLPRKDSDAERWARVQMKVLGPEGLPPIEVYQIGEAYFVRDGHHRVSVARQLGATHMEAYVTEVRSKVPITPDTQPDDLILKAEYTAFLESTQLDELCPEANLTVTVPGQYDALKEHIDVHHYFMGLDQQRDIPYGEAVKHWYDVIYLPVVQVIRGRGILRDFPGRTEADLYLWVSEHLSALKHQFGWEVPPEEAAVDLATQSGYSSRRTIARVVGKLADAAVPDALEGGPYPGQWRKEHVSVHKDNRLFTDVLVPINGKSDGWCALQQALHVAQREEAKLRGLHVVSSPDRQDARDVQTIKAEFDRRCAAAGVPGTLAIGAGKVSRAICEEARWADLVVVNLSHPPPPEPVARLGSGFRALIQRCPRPVLAVPNVSSAMNRAVLAYDGSPKADEALFIATYLAGHWNISLVVVTAQEQTQTTASGIQASARKYLEMREIEAVFVEKNEPAPTAILQTAQTYESDLIIMGGYGFKPVVEAVLGSSVDRVLRESRQPVLICR